MIVYVPGRMPTHVSPYGAARYPGSFLGSAPGGFRNLVPSLSGNQVPTYYPDLNLRHPQPDFSSWPRRMPVEEELGTSPPAGLPSLGASPNSLGTAGPASPAHSDSDASSSSLELGSVRRGENTQLKCRWEFFRPFYVTKFYVHFFRFFLRLGRRDKFNICLTTIFTQIAKSAANVCHGTESSITYHKILNCTLNM